MDEPNYRRLNRSMSEAGSSQIIGGSSSSYKRRYKVALIVAIAMAVGLISTIVIFLSLQKQTYSRLAQLNINNTHTIEEKNELIARLTDENTALNQTIAKQNETIRQQNSTISQLNDTIYTLNNTIKQKDKLIDALNSQITDLNVEIAKDQQTIKEQEKTIEDLKKGIVPKFAWRYSALILLVILILL